MKAKGPTHARLSFHLYGIQNPGGQIMFLECSDESKLPPEQYRNRLLSRAELDEIFPNEMTSLRDLEKQKLQ
jgi:hypothetical protein